MFLYQLVIDIDPDYLNSGIIEFVERQRVRTKPHRLQLLIEQVRLASRRGKWNQVAQLANSMLEIDPKNAFALREAQIAQTNVACEPMYELAKAAHKNGNETAVTVLMQDIQIACPDYGDPAEILANQRIAGSLVEYLHNSHTLAGHMATINRVTFSHHGNLLATASNDHTVKIWSSLTGELLHDLREHSDRVNSVAFSRDDKYFSSVSADGIVRLWHVKSWEPIQKKVVSTSANDVVLSQDNNLLIVGDDDGVINAFSLPNLGFINAIKTCEGWLTSVDISTDGRLFASSAWKSGYKHSGHIRVWNTRNWEQIHMYGLEENWSSQYIRRSLLSDDGKYLAAVGDRLHVWKMPQARSYFSTHLFHTYIPDLGMSSSRKSEGLNVSGKDVTFMSHDSSILILAGVYNEEGRIVFVPRLERKAGNWSTVGT